MHELTQLIKEDMRPALGVTEPGAIAYAVSKAKSFVPGAIENVTLLLNSGMYKNAYTCGIPNSHFYGNEYAAALGAVAGKPEKEKSGKENLERNAKNMREISVKTELNKEQEAAVHAQERIIAVAAGPGTGKTKTLIAHLYDLIANRI